VQVGERLLAIERADAQLVERQVGDKTRVISIGHNAGMKKIDPARERGLPVMAVADLLEVIDR